jgi:glucose-6-phosphate isomerase
MLHQGTDAIPVEFILVKRESHALADQQTELPAQLQGQQAMLPERLQSQQTMLLEQLQSQQTMLLEQLQSQQTMLLANGLAQAQALMLGKTADQALAEKAPTAAPDIDARTLARHRTFSGNRPSTTLMLDRLTPRSLGALIAMYEHRVFTSGAVWGINSFDQWGVELGKALCNDLLPRLTSGDVAGLDGSTAGLMRRLRAG